MVRNKASHLENNKDEEFDEFLNNPALRKNLLEISGLWVNKLVNLVELILAKLLFEVIQLAHDAPEFLAIDLLALDVSHLVGEVDDDVKEAHSLVRWVSEMRESVLYFFVQGLEISVALPRLIKEEN